MSASELLTGGITRRLHHLELSIKSAPIESAMRLLSRGRKRRPAVTEQCPGWGTGMELYHLETVSNGLIGLLPGFNYGRFDLWGGRELLFSRAPKFNLAPFLTVGLENGITLKVPTVISEKQLAEYREGLKSAVIQFYIDFLKESSIKIRITTETVETEPVPENG